MTTVVDNIARAGGCSHPIRLKGSVEVATDTGARVDGWSTDSMEGGETYVACKTRRASRCPSCARVYQGDAYQLIVAGLRGGKGVPSAVSDHPALFVTLTAPGFGAVHQHRNGACRPRRKGGACRHGRPLACWTKHSDEDDAVGQPICNDCFDYEAAVMWNAHAPALWRVTRINTDRVIAKHLGVPVSKLRGRCRTEYVKVAEFQKRGLVHFHIAIRIDGPTPEDAPPLTVDELEVAVREAVRMSSVALPDEGRASWGAQVDVAEIEPDDEASTFTRGQAAGYLGKYATKGSDGEGALDRRFLHLDERRVRCLRVNAHLRRMVWTSWQLADRHPDLRSDAWAHQLGYRGHFMTKSRRWSTTFLALRSARAEIHQRARLVSWQALRPEARLVITSKWDFAGTGYRTEGEAALAQLLRKPTQTTRVA